MNLITKFATVSALLLACCSFTQAQSAAATAATAGRQYEPQLENERNPNEYCAKCHSFDTEADQAKGIFHAGKFHGIHLSKTNPATGKPITCVSCHGNISEDHRKGVKDVMRFNGDIFSNEKPMYSAQEQNQVCFSCHQPKDLRAKFWAHDVHAMKLPCASCHTLHPEKDKMQGIEQKQRVKLCVDCHGEQRARKEAAEKAAAQQPSSTEQKDNQ